MYSNDIEILLHNNAFYVHPFVPLSAHSFRSDRALHLAVASERYKSVQKILDQGGDPHAVDSEGMKIQMSQIQFTEWTLLNIIIHDLLISGNS